MRSLRQYLTKKGYQRVALGKLETGHLNFRAQINGVDGLFILDTGASNSCVDLENAKKFKLLAEDSEVKAAGAGATDMLTQVATNNFLTIGEWRKENVTIILFDLTHVNLALTNHQIENVCGIIGADILDKGRAIIDYQYQCMYLK
ncbi:MAG: retropepsin-like aspartic protease [Leeuwenhoekiella sp.]